MYKPGMTQQDYLEAINVLDQDTRTIAKAKDDYRKFYLAQYQRERRSNLNPITIEFTDDELRKIVPKSNALGRGLSSFLKVIVLKKVSKLQLNNGLDIALKSMLLTSAQILRMIRQDMADEVKRSMVDQQLEKIEQLTNASNDS